MAKGHSLWNTNYCGWDNDKQLRYGRCQCGAESAIVSSRAAVERWHREHKDAIRNARAKRKPPTQRASGNQKFRRGRKPRLKQQHKSKRRISNGNQEDQICDRSH